jgi:hypothetical protein
MILDRLLFAAIALASCDVIAACGGTTRIDASRPPGSTGGSSALPDAGGASPGGPLWTSDDGPILGIVAAGERIVCVTSTKLVSVARSGGDARVLSQSSASVTNTGAIAANSDAIFWGTQEGIESTPLGGGTVTVVGVEGYDPVGIALDSSNVYWITDDAIMKAPLGGGVAPLKLAALEGLSYGDAFTLVGGTLYWATNDSAVGPAIAELLRLPAIGGTPQVVRPTNVYSIQPSGPDGVAWLEEPTPVIVTFSAADQSTHRIPLSGWVNEVAGDGARWYWKDEGTGVAYALDGPSAVPRALTSAVSGTMVNNGVGWHVIVEGGVLYWADRSGSFSDARPEVNVLRGMAVGL